MKQAESRLYFKNRIFWGWKLSLALLLASISILGLTMLAGVDFDYIKLNALYKQLGLPLIVTLLLLSSINFAFRALRWHWFTKRLNLEVPLSDSVVYYLAGFSMGVTPGRMGELIRLWLLRRGHKISYHRGLPLMIADRVNDLLVIIMLTLCSGIMISTNSLEYIVLALLLIVIANMALRYPYYLLAAINAIYGITQRWRRLFAAARRSLRTGCVMFSLPNAIFASIYSTLAWLSECLAFYLLLHALGINMTLEQATFIFVFSTLVGALSFLPGGLGGFEATAVILLSGRGVDLGTAIFATTVFRLTALWYSVALGTILLTYIMFYKKPKHAQVQQQE